jgi:hypothetical protein
MTFDQIQQHPLYQRYYEGPTCTAYNPQDGLLYVGLTSYRNDILYSFNPSTKVFRSLGFQAAGERFDVKVHRSLEIDDSGGIFGATACLHDIDQQGEAPGGKIFRYDPKEGKIELLGIPNPPWYIQTITLDRKRQIIYGYTYKRCDLFRFDIKTRSTRLLAFTERDGHNLVIDDQGNLWAFWLQSFGLQGGASPRTTMLKYEPESNRLVWLHNLALPGFSSSDWTYVDMAINGQDGFLYFGMTNGTLLRFDPQ